MRIALIADTFPPMRSSGAVQLRDLAFEFSRQGHRITAIISTPELKSSWTVEDIDTFQVLRLRSPRTRGRGYIARTIGEILMPYFMLRGLRHSPLVDIKFEAIIWYSPTIFLGPIIKALKSESGCPAYLIIRDIFPQWAWDVGIIRNKLIYSFFNSIANYQYEQADVIGIQTPGNKSYFSKADSKPLNAKIEVLHNWLSNSQNIGCSLRVEQTKLVGRTIFVYAGNMGVAQNVVVFCKLAERIQLRRDLGFLFVGRGSESSKLAGTYGALPNVFFANEIDAEEIPGLYAQCQVGLVALDSRHKSHNIPGKFLSYMQAGLPVLACVNQDNDLTALINAREVGIVITEEDDELVDKAVIDILLLAQDSGMKIRCKDLADSMFSTASAVRQIVSAFRA
jgi:glycosyltransferase involved in cell wall biosynthesis